MVRLAVVDVDGCLNAGEGKRLDLESLGRLAAINSEALAGRGPAITLCTGRQGPYVEVFMDAIGAFLPGLFELGCGMYDPRDYSFLAHPAISPQHLRALAEVRRLLTSAVIEPGLGQFSLGKEFMATVYPRGGISLDELAALCRQRLANVQEYRMLQSATCVDFVPVGVDKGAGVRWLAERTGIPLEDMGGVGDSNTDWTFLSLTGESAAPANAQEELRRRARYVSPYPYIAGTLDIIRHWRDGQ